MEVQVTRLCLGCCELLRAVVSFAINVGLLSRRVSLLLGPLFTL